MRFAAPGSSHVETSSAKNVCISGFAHEDSGDAISASVIMLSWSEVRWPGTALKSGEEVMAALLMFWRLVIERVRTRGMGWAALFKALKRAARTSLRKSMVSRAASSSVSGDVHSFAKWRAMLVRLGRRYMSEMAEARSAVKWTGDSSW